MNGALNCIRNVDASLRKGHDKMRNEKGARRRGNGNPWNKQLDE